MYANILHIYIVIHTKKKILVAKQPSHCPQVISAVGGASGECQGIFSATFALKTPTWRFSRKHLVLFLANNQKKSRLLGISLIYIYIYHQQIIKKPLGKFFYDPFLGSWWLKPPMDQSILQRRNGMMVVF